MKEMYKQLNLVQLEEVLPQLLDQARREQWTYETLLERALTAEVEGREQKAIARRLKAARIPSKKTLDGFDFSFQPSLSERRLRELGDLSGCRGRVPMSSFLALQEPAKRISASHWRAEHSPLDILCSLQRSQNLHTPWRVPPIQG